MKLIHIDRDALLKPLQAVAGIVERRHTLPILSNVLLEATDKQLLFTATDLEIQVSTAMERESGGDETKVTVSARKLLDILRALPEASVVDMETQASRVTLKAGKSRFNLQMLPAEDFPRLTEAEGTVSIRIQQKALRALLMLVQYAMAQQDIRYYLNGLLLSAANGEFKVVATDGHRLAYASMSVAGITEKQEVILPRKAVLELTKLLGDTDEEVVLGISTNQVKFEFSGILLQAKVVDGKFPDFQRVIPTNYVKSITLDRSTLLQALQRASILSNEKFRGVRWMLTKGSLRISCSNNEHEEAQEELEVDYQGEAIDIGFNVNYLLDVLNNVESSSVCCLFGDASSSVLMTKPDDPSFKYVIMPMRI